MRNLTHIMIQHLRKPWWTLLMVTLLSQAAPAGIRTLHLPTYQANPGEIIKIPLQLIGCDSVAGVQLQINFDPAILSITDIQPGALGETFEYSFSHDNGVASLLMARADALSSGTGTLAILTFQVNPGAEEGLTSDLAIAGFELSDETGVITLTGQSQAKAQNGKIHISRSNTIDNYGNGLVDRWEEQHGMNVLRQGASHLDDDGDGLQNIFEYLLGGNPQWGDSATYRPKHAISLDPENGRRYLTLTYQRRQGEEGERLSVWESANLKDWWKLNPNTQMPQAPENLGNGFEKVTLQGILPIEANGGHPCGFLQLRSDELDE
jgi:hypothetical protein